MATEIGGRVYGYRAVLFDPAGSGNNFDLGTLGGAEAQARSINDAGQIVGDAEDSQGYWSTALFDPSGAGNNIDLNAAIDPASGWTLRFAYDINNSGWIVGRGWNPQGKVRAFLLVPKSPSKYGGGTGEPDDAYQIATAEDLMLLGETPKDYDKHFILTADIDLDPNLPGRKVFNMAVIAADTIGVAPDFQGIPFKGVFDGNLHDISHLTIVGDNYLGLFGRIDKTVRISNLALKAVNVKGTSDCIGGLAGYNLGAIIQCSVNGTVEGKNRIGGLVGDNAGPITRCSTNCLITGNQYVGGLLGFNWTADISACFSSSRVVGISWVGGLVGISGYISSPPAGLAGPPPGSISYPPETIISSCYSTGHVEGGAQVGGLAGENKGSIQFSYSAARVEDSGLLLVDNTSFGGLVGTNNHGVVLLSFWDAELSNLPYSTAGRGRTTEQMMDANTFSGWGYSGEWVIDEGNDYPRLAWEGLEGKPIIDTPNRYAGGTGIPDDPYKIHTSDELIRLSNHPIDWDKCFVLTSNIDFNHVDPNLISPIGVYGMPFKGSFNGNHYTISNFHCLSEAESYIGVFGSIGPEISYRSYATMSHDPNDSGSVMNLNIENVRVLGYNCVGGVAGYNSGIISNCSVTGNVTAVSKDAGSLLGFNDGEITDCYAIGNVKSELVAGGLIGHNKGPIKGCSFSGSVEEKGTHGGWCSGGLIGYNYSTIESCHFNGDITGSSYTGGLIGLNGSTVSSCFALGNVTGMLCRKALLQIGL
jgi:hypothetical protein